MIAVGFEPTPPERLEPKSSALDHSATLPLTADSICVNSNRSSSLYYSNCIYKLTKLILKFFFENLKVRKLKNFMRLLFYRRTVRKFILNTY